MCGIQSLGGADLNKGHLHLLKSGKLTLVCEDGHKVKLEKPSVLFMPGPTKHQIIADESDNAELVCVDIEFNAGCNISLITALPKFLCLDIAANEELGKTAHWLFNEAFEENSGKHIIINKLCDIFLVQVLRHVLKHGLIEQGTLAGSSHPKLSGVINALHTEPEKAWTIESMAEVALMSRSKFAALFKETVGLGPNEYLTDLRISIAQELLQNDRSVSLVANDVGYEHGSALARVFRKKVGLSPKQWLQKLKK